LAALGSRFPPHAEPSLTPEEVRERVAAARVATLATIDAEGRPNLVPVTFVLEGDVFYTAVDHKPKTTRDLNRLANIRRDARVTLLVHSYEEDWDNLWWCRLNGSARIVDDVPESLGVKYEQYRERLPAGPVIAVTIQQWTGWSAKKGEG
jgi:PPOX class probable F420-dependent enzyme